MSLKNKITCLLKDLDIDDVGFADASLYKRVEGGSIPNEISPRATTVIVHLYQLKKMEERYGKWYIVSLNNHISSTNKKLVEFLANLGFEARGIQENEYSRKTLVGKISFRQMAVLAGLGSIGRSSMLIHSGFGPRVVIGVVLTNAKIAPNKPFERALCTNCGICTESCPIKAINDKFNRWKCKNRRKILKKGCGTPCVELCPIGQ